MINFEGQVITVPKRIAMETTALECEKMRQSRRCNESPMMKSENKWLFNQGPDDVGYWLRTNTLVMMNYMVEEVILSRVNEGDMINTLLGKTNVSHGSLSQNHLKLFWIDTYGKPTDIAIRQLEKVGLPRTIDATLSNCEMSQKAWTVIGENHLFIIKYPLGSAAVTVPSVIKDIVPRSNESLDINI
ncbi:hypothetical protein OUZ56_012168 [Daphnia magna]|uniref:Uncharacterized protein n=1 Tax=Daphnia magna TaxID=35525 RepID=A0ABQ9Z2F4_9CRUS|nr:hypothetical protein OUZ56_012168 [Daphnia magna]